MAYVTMPKDLGKVKTKIAFNLTKRQMICFSLAGIVGYGFYMISNGINQDIRLYMMMGIILPFVVAGIYEKDGVSFEKYLKYRYETEYKNPKIRIYSSKNLYEQIMNGDDIQNAKTSKKAKTKASKRGK